MLALRTSSSWLSPSAAQSFSRSYAISVQPPKIFPKKRIPRVFGEKKSFQYNSYMRILETSKTSPLIFLQHNDFSAHRLIRLRREIDAASHRATLSLSSPTPATPVPRLTVVRTSIFGVVLRDFSDIDFEGAAKIADGLSAGLAILSLPILDPPQLSAVLRALDRGVPPRKPKTDEELAKELAEKNADPVTPGRRVKRIRPILQPELKVVGALIDSHVFLPDAVRDVSKLPTLDTLRAQIVGLLSAPATQLAGVLNEASGMRLARTLEGLRKGLEESQSSVTSQ